MSFATRKTSARSAADFRAAAKAVEVVINEVKEFSTGSFGWHHGDKLTIKVGDTLVRVQMAGR